MICDLPQSQILVFDISIEEVTLLEGRVHREVKSPHSQQKLSVSNQLNRLREGARRGVQMK
jgi:hypothetical protein